MKDSWCKERKKRGREEGKWKVKRKKGFDRGKGIVLRQDERK